jgi:hypothetical protein
MSQLSEPEQADYQSPSRSIPGGSRSILGKFASCSKRQERGVSIMGRLFRSFAMVSMVLLSTKAFAQDLPCGAFRRNLLGSWSALRLVTIQGPEGPISMRRGRTFRLGDYYKGLDLAALLERNCRGRIPNSFPETLAQNVPCGAFRRNLLGSWSALRLVTIQGPEGPISIRRGRTFRLEDYYKGLNLAALLEQKCR